MLAASEPNFCVPADRHRTLHTYADCIPIHSTRAGKASTQRFCSGWYNHRQSPLEFQRSYLAFFILDLLFTVHYLKIKSIGKGLFSNKSRRLWRQVWKPKGITAVAEAVSYKTCIPRYSRTESAVTKSSIRNGKIQRGKNRADDFWLRFLRESE